MTLTPEPDIRKYHNPEKALQKAVREEIERILKKMKSERILIDYFILECFGLDLCVFMKRSDGQSTMRLFELKSFVGSRQRGVGIGNQQGKGAQIDLLMLPNKNMNLCDEFVRWILADGTRPKGTNRYGFFGMDMAKNATIGTVERGKQNNLRVRDLIKQALTWNDLAKRLEEFLLF